ncbi:Tfp pilus assembly protein PilX [Planomicrobium stackebrandtii]|uniref:Tfp pilus assembly protein PilX n=1 Tax=Planomicrobium stackebrandtii TaxID=253160 RepID=A0ABU0GYV2_9BACL|nr:pilus assembly PilX N-terminal domain-containing protein [Planomicrobium stackebrandtii]MDQ0430534.1 Tfp pilus assembly protein PilX [Planomicrobium stackebrandtii]
MSKLLKNRYLFKSEVGYTLPIVLLILVFFSILGISLISITMNSLKLSDSERKDQAVYYIAESGTTVVLSDIDALVDSLSNSQTIQNEQDFFAKLEQDILNSKVINEFEENSGETPFATVTVKLLEIDENLKERKYEIVSKGEIGTRTRTVGGDFSVSFSAGDQISLPPNLGVFSNDKILLSNGTIEGNLILNKYSSKGIEISGNPSVKGDIIVPVASGNNVFSAPTWWINENKPAILKEHQLVEYPLPPFPEFPINFATMPNMNVGNHKVVSDKNINITSYLVENHKIILDKNYEINNITFNSNRKLTFIVNEDRSIVVNNISGSGHLHVEGKGKLTIYLKDNIQIDGNLNPQNTDNLFIYVGPSKTPSVPKTIKSSSYAQFNASVYAKDANLEVVGSAGVTGHLVTGGQSVKFSGGTQGTASGTVVFAPNAAVELTGSGTLRGGVISKTFKMDGGAKVISNSVNLNENPFWQVGSSEKGEAGFTKLLIKEIPN